jgi:hypothetical protein
MKRVFVLQAYNMECGGKIVVSNMREKRGE